MEREVSDTEAVFSRRLSSNWAELPTTLRRRQKHRPEILSQFTDFSESSESEFRKIDTPMPFTSVQRIVRRSEFLRKLEANESAPIVRIDRRSTPDRSFTRIDEDYRKHYDDHETRLGQRRKSVGNLANRFDLKSLSDEDRKTNSPDSLLVKSSESDLSSDEYGHTDDSGAFLEKASNERAPKSEHRSRFIKFFAKDDCKRQKKKTEEKSTHLDVNKNSVKQLPKSFESNRKDQRKESLTQQKFEYENIPRIDVSKLDQKSYLNPTVRSIGTSAENSTERVQPTIEQLRMEEGCQLRNTTNASSPQPGFGRNFDEPKKFRTPSPNRQRQCEDIRLDGLIQDFYDSEQIAGRTSNGDRKLSKMETITEENPDGSKLSVREILKRFEELRIQSEMQVEEKSNDRTLTTIQETLKKLDEKVKSYQVTILIELVSSIKLKDVARFVTRSVDHRFSDFPHAVDFDRIHIPDSPRTVNRSAGFSYDYPPPAKFTRPFPITYMLPTMLRMKRKQTPNCISAAN